MVDPPSGGFSHSVSSARLTVNREQAAQKQQGGHCCFRVGCNIPGKLVCTGCRAVFYCSPTCQKQDWKSRHKRGCKSKPAPLLPFPVAQPPTLVSPPTTVPCSRVECGEPSTSFCSKCKATYCSEACLGLDWASGKHSAVCKVPVSPVNPFNPFPTWRLGFPASKFPRPDLLRALEDKW